jgi:hypothetical protein
LNIHPEKRGEGRIFLVDANGHFKKNDIQLKDDITILEARF